MGNELIIEFLLNNDDFIKFGQRLHDKINIRKDSNFNTE